MSTGAVWGRVIGGVSVGACLTVGDGVEADALLQEAPVGVQQGVVLHTGQRGRVRRQVT